MRDSRGLEGLGMIYLVISCIAAVVFLIAGFSLVGGARWWLFGAAAGAVLQGFLFQAVLGWMSDVVAELAGIRGELSTLRSPVTKTQVSGPSGVRPEATGGQARVVEAWGARQCSVCYRNLPPGEHASCPHCGTRFEEQTGVSAGG